jgi:ribosomal protein S6
VKRYEGLFILNTAGKEETLKDTIDKIAADIATAGAKVETVQKMDKKPFARIADRKMTAGFYLNIIFECSADTLNQLRRRFGTNEEIYRVMFSLAPVAKAEVAPVAVAQ